MSEPRAYTAEEVREEFLGAVDCMTSFWAKLPDKTPQERLDGLVHSILCIIDGVSGSSGCGYMLVPSTHPSDEAYHRDNGENWYPAAPDVPGLVDIGGGLHDAWGKICGPRR